MRDSVHVAQAPAAATLHNSHRGRILEASPRHPASDTSALSSTEPRPISNVPGKCIRSGLPLTFHRRRTLVTPGPWPSR